MSHSPMIRSFVRGRSLCAALLFLSLVLPSPTRAQSMDGTGLVATGLLLRQMDGVKRVLMIAAHPDDEDTSLLTTLARGWGAETAYLSLTRGDGGQNLIGPELWEGLGIVRTGELVAARDLDGAQQFFTRAFDYGFSKSADEALSLWPREELLEDVVLAVRRYRPHVIVSVFSGTPSDGHGQHQAAGIMAREAFAAAGDPERFPEQLARGLEAWTPLKLYQRSRRQFAPPGTVVNDGAIDVETGTLDPLLGRSLLQLSMESRSQHRSQDMGAAQPAGPRLTGVILIDSRAESSGEGIFSGIDTTLVGLAERVPAGQRPAVRSALEAYRAAISQAQADFGMDLQRIVPHLMAASRHLAAAQAAGQAGADSEFRTALASKADVVERALFAATGVSFTVRTADDLLVPGETVEVTAQLWNGGAQRLSLPTAVLETPPGWTITETSVQGLDSDGSVPAGALVTWRYEVGVPADARLSRLYYLEAPRDDARYRWPAGESELWGLPGNPPLVEGNARFAFADDAANTMRSISTPWRFVGVDPAFGQFEKPVLVVPELSVAVAPSGVTWPQGQSNAREVSVVVRSESVSGSRGEVAISAPAEWTVSPPSQPFDLAEAGAERTMTFALRPAATVAAGRHTFEVVATTDDGRRFDEGYSLIDYDHIERTAIFTDAEATVSIVPVQVRDGLRVGYIMGSGDDGPEAIRQMGADVELLDPARVRDGDFSGLTTVVLGVRAYETRPDLQAASAQLLDFARQGGTVIVQYNRGPLGSLAPYDLQVGRGSPRVADETAEMQMLLPESPLFTSPNRIVQADFDGWVQERGLYFASEWDDRYTSVFELHDEGEEPRYGSTLVAPVGDGIFVYSALSFFRQWAGQVPGAYRLFANLISLDPTEWNAFAGRP